MKNDFALIFDMDGVVVDNFSYHRKAWEQFCIKYSLDFDRAFRSKVFGGTNKDHLETFFERTLSDSEVRQYEEEKERLYRTLYEKDIHAVDGLISFLMKASKQNVPCGLATSSPHVNVDFVLKKTKTKEYFSVICDSGSITQGKPHPEIFLITAKKLGFPPNRCIVFEDSLNGIEAARRSGSRVVALLTTHQKQDLPSVDRMLHNFENLELQDLRNLL